MRFLSGAAGASLAPLALLIAFALALAVAASGEQPRHRPAAALAPAAAPVMQPAQRVAYRPERPDREPRVPTAAALRSAKRFAAERTGLVSFAVRRSDGGLRGREIGRSFDSASLVKALLLAAELHRLDSNDLALDATTERTLRAMITVSDNAAASAIYARVGDGGLLRVADRVGLKRFTVSGYWSNAQLTAADMARFFSRLDRALAGRYSEFGLGLLGSIAPEQSWGIPAAASDRWAVRFKGGWLPSRALVNQAAELRDRRGPADISIAVLTDQQPSFAYGTETVRGIAERLLERSRR